MKYIVILVCLVCFSVPASAAGILDSYSVDLGKSSEDVDVLRIGLQRNFCSLREDRNISLAGFLELSFNYWGGMEDEIYGLGLSPVFRLTLFNGRKVKPYIEGGIGVSLISETTIETRNLSSAFQFEDRIGLMVNAGNVGFHLKYMHYSNASIKKPNNGMDLFLIGVSVQL